jgi:cytoskeletal protein CcmA (bactofilin family)
MRFNTSHDRLVAARSDRPPTVSDLNTPKPRARSVLECSVRLTGDLWSDGDVQIDGHLCGNISCEQLIVGRNAAVTGVIIAQEAVIRGRTTGIIRATRVLLQATARVEGEMIYHSLMVDEGATFEGVARSKPNPLVEDFAVSTTPAPRQMIGPGDTSGGNWAGADCDTSPANAHHGEAEVTLRRPSGDRQPLAAGEMGRVVSQPSINPWNAQQA